MTDVINKGTIEPLALVQPGAPTPMSMLERAVTSGASIEVLEKLMGLQERYERNEGRKAFDAAIAAAKTEIPVIVKNRTVDFTSPKGRTNYQYEDLAEIARTVDPILGKHGLSYRFRTTSTPNEPVSVTCIVSHRMGHSEENTLCAGRDETGNKNAIQAIGSTVTFLQRYTLKAALGLAASVDDDAQSVNKASDKPATIELQQAQELMALIENTGGDVTKFCAFAGVKALADIPATRYDSLMQSVRDAWVARQKKAEAKAKKETAEVEVKV